MPDDATLLRRYAEERSEAAFAELVRRYLDLVYSAALRRVDGDAHRAADVAQTVFVSLARDARRLTGHRVLTGWLYAAARNAALNALRAERRRRTHEQEAMIMHDQLANAAPAETDWDQLRPELDRIMDELADADRTAVLLRFFEKRSFAEIGAALELSEDAALMRTDRALDKLRTSLARRGITSTAAALTTVLASHGVSAAPAALYPTIATAVAAGTGVAAGSAGILALMSTSKISPAIAVVAALVAVGAALYERNLAHLTAASLATAQAANATALARSRELARLGEREAQRVAELQRELVRVSVPPSNPAAVEAGRAFLAAHPEAQALIEAMRSQNFELLYGAALQALDLAPEERWRIAAEAAKALPFRGTFGQMRFEDGDAPGAAFNEALFNRLRELLGEERFARYIEARRWDQLRGLVKSAAATLYETDTPVQHAQAQAMIASLTRHSRNRGDGRNRQGVSINWPAVAAELEPTLPTAQFSALHKAHENALLRRDIFRYFPSMGSPAERGAGGKP